MNLGGTPTSSGPGGTHERARMMPHALRKPSFSPDAAHRTFSRSLFTPSRKWTKGGYCSIADVSAQESGVPRSLLLSAPLERAGAALETCIHRLRSVHCGRPRWIAGATEELGRSLQGCRNVPSHGPKLRPPMPKPDTRRKRPKLQTPW